MSMEETGTGTAYPGTQPMVFTENMVKEENVIRYNIPRSVFPRIDDYFGVWAIEESRFRGLVDAVREMDLAAHINASERIGVEGGYSYRLEKGVAIIRIEGTLMRHASSLGDSTSTIAARRTINEAARNDDVNAILLQIHSPGGAVDGTKELADAVADANKQKPVVSYIDGLGASAAYWVASQAGKVYSSETALVGSIGTYAALYDYSGNAALNGVKVHVIKAGKFKGTGVEGAAISEAAIEEAQGLVNRLNEFFVGAVADGRGISQEAANELNDGRIHVGQDAVALGLTDGVRTYEETLGELQALTKGSGSTLVTGKSDGVSLKGESPDATGASETIQKGDSDMEAATLAELKAGCVGASAEFVLAQLEKGVTLSEAQTAWAKELNQRLDNEMVAREEAEAKAAQRRPGVEPCGTRTTKAKAGEEDEDIFDPINAWDKAVEREMKGRSQKREAIRAVIAKDPDLYDSYLKAYNDRHHGARRNRKETDK